MAIGLESKPIAYSAAARRKPATTPCFLFLLLVQVAKLPYKPEEAEEFERAWLALADIHIQGGKFDLAQVGKSGVGQ